MVDVLTSILIDCPQDKVAAYASNPENAPAWYVNIKSAEWRTPKPLSIGSQIAFKAKLLAPFVATAMRKANQKDLKLLKTILEKKVAHLYQN